MRLLALTLLVVTNLLTFSSAYSAIEENDGDYANYNQIVNELESTTKVSTSSYFSETQLHFGAGYSNSLIKLNGANLAKSVNLQGFQIGFGMDFTPNFITEVYYTNFTPETKRSIQYSLQEYGMRGIFRSHMSRTLAGRLGFGVSARSLEVSGRDFTTPTSQIFGGAELKFGPKASIITEIAYKDSFTNDTPERNALDLTVRIDGHF